MCSICMKSGTAYYADVTDSDSFHDATGVIFTHVVLMQADFLQQDYKCLIRGNGLRCLFLYRPMIGRSFFKYDSPMKRFLHSLQVLYGNKPVPLMHLWEDSPGMMIPLIAFVFTADTSLILQALFLNVLSRHCVDCTRTTSERFFYFIICIEDSGG